MGVDSPVCLFRCKTRPYAVAVDAVAEIVEIASLVRVGLCPPWIVGLCPYHREVVPVVDLGAGIPRPGPIGSDQAGARESAGEAVLIMQTSQGVWGIAVGRDGTVIIKERASPHEPKEAEGGVVSIGLVRHEGADYPLLDAEATWRGLRDAVVEWFARISESMPESRARFGESAGIAGDIGRPNPEEKLGVSP
jgi:purine-binding chemotaxis protein CheW